MTETRRMKAAIIASRRGICEGAGAAVPIGPIPLLALCRGTRALASAVPFKGICRACPAGVVKGLDADAERE